MISMTGWHVDIPLHYTIGFQGENNVNRFDIAHNNEDQYTYQLDVHFIDKDHLIDYRNIFNLELSDNVLSLVFKKEMLPYNGKYEFQVVGYKDADIIKKSNIFCAFVQRSINADGSWDPLPDAFEELREEILEARDTASQAAEDAVDALGKTNKVIDGIWYVWDSSTQEYVSTGETARGPEGPEGKQGSSATIRVGNVLTGDPGSDASITNSGDSSNAVFDFVIPRGGRGPAGTTLYSDLSDKPTINGVEVSGNKTSADYKIENVQPDWEQNNESSSDYIKNRICYKETQNITIYESILFKASSSNVLTYTSSGGDFDAVSTHRSEITKINIDNSDYPCSISFSRGYFYISGEVNGSWYYSSGRECELTFTGANFTIGNSYLVNFASGEPSILYHKIDANYIPIGSSFKVENGLILSNVGRKYNDSTSENAGEIFNNYIGNIASGRASHAEGSSTTASNYFSHAEGSSTTASGHSSHAEGSSTTASGESSHAEGSSTTASGYASHAEGSHTIASRDDSHVEGTYNIEDTGGLYAHIVGGGTYSARKNIHTLDWNGNANYSGDVYVQASEDDATGGKKVATEEYVSEQIEAHDLNLSVEANKLPAGDSPTIDIIKSTDTQTIVFGIPSGQNGDPGQAATIAITETETVPAGTSAAMVELPESTPQARVYKAQIPQGPAGAGVPPTDTAAEGDVPTWNGQQVVWAPPAGGDGSGPFELIFETTLSEDVDSVVITQDTSGAGFSLIEALVEVSIQTNTENVTVSANAYPGESNPYIKLGSGTFYTIASTSAYRATHTVRWILQGGLWFCYCGANRGNTAHAAYSAQMAPSIHNSAPYQKFTEEQVDRIRKIELPYAMKTGTSIQIYGVRG